jgi:hypothetical protein
MITITINTEAPLTDLEQALLRVLLDEAPAAKATPAPAKKAAAPKPTAVPDPEPEEDLVGGGATLEDAVAKATELVAAGKTAAVKAALAAAGAKRVSELSGAKIQVFLDALDV